jgi:hypothetical protein
VNQPAARRAGRWCPPPLRFPALNASAGARSDFEALVAGVRIVHAQMAARHFGPYVNPIRAGFVQGLGELINGYEIELSATSSAQSAQGKNLVTMGGESARNSLDLIERSSTTFCDDQFFNNPSPSP